MFKIILADDEPIIIKGMQKMIEWEKLNAEIVAEAGNGAELLEKIREFEPDIVISDVAMPKMTGLDVIKEIQDNHWSTKVIFLSGYQEFEYVQKAIRYEAIEYLLKPVGKEELGCFKSRENTENRLSYGILGEREGRYADCFSEDEFGIGM